MPVESTQAFAMTRRRSREHPGIRNDKKERSRADRLEVVESCIGWREWHMHDLSLLGAVWSVTVEWLTRKRRSNLACDG
jgi:hypothetical protein